ncbi:aminotransferase class III-fold pyridoxal phosphate-dependent enzyme [Roseomonas terrae]|uniref:Aminotransferase class III-fold pyridoxal phosphate-dependent enzyme n=1 Tax=Neoroseomonas terrae TaxID=424799 RepID=A0ABS5EIH5_9PROT|nr:aminotransferase class III-fold pyridoxal phosphate-dependent enzyme [Neoroseomonas terrae]MBR0650822.1 aminotransferase class III-fold pyridoxal phosphate-dependent enzyme [Neoroseomonas terrae]
MDTTTNSPIVTAYLARTPSSADAYRRARAVFPAGVTHDSRYQLPHPLSVTHAAGARKWDSDGNEYVDYVGGHGALILGHAPPEVMARVAEQAMRGTHYGANHDLELRWGELVQAMVPCAELVRFTNSGTEATLMAMRLARAATGRSRILRLRGHFHGWHDHVAFGVTHHFDGSASAGVLPALAEQAVLVDPNDEAGLIAALDAHEGEIAAAFLEPTGSTYGQVPLRPDFVQRMREETAKRGILLIFDEVVTGFRVSRGGAQQALGITPDLATLAKILAGGLPGGAVVGRRDVLELLDPERAAQRGVEKIGHQGTFNANPLSAAAGVATLEILRDTDVLDRTHAYAAAFIAAANDMFCELGLPWVAYGAYGAFHIFINPNGLPVDPRSFDAASLGYADLKLPRGNRVAGKLRLATRLFGVDLSPWPGGLASGTHGEAELAQTLDALRGAIRLLREEGEIA